MVLATTSKGETVEIEVPEGVEPGAEFEVSVMLGTVGTERGFPRANSDIYLDGQMEKHEASSKDHEGVLMVGDPNGESAASPEKTETLLIACPEGIGPGELLFVSTSTGQEVEVSVPDGVGPGDEFEVTVALGSGIDAELTFELEEAQQSEHGEEQEDAPFSRSTEVLSIVCPEGVSPGDMLLVGTSTGEEVQVQVPDGVEPGDEFEVSVDLGGGASESMDGGEEKVPSRAEAEATAEKMREADSIELERLTAEEEVLASEAIDEANEAEVTDEEAAAEIAKPGSFETLVVACPDGVAPGELLLVTTSAGLEVEVEVPQNIEPGDEFEVHVELSG